MARGLHFHSGDTTIVGLADESDLLAILGAEVAEGERGLRLAGCR